MKKLNTFISVKNGDNRDYKVKIFNLNEDQNLYEASL